MILVFLLYALFGLSFTLGKITLYYAKPFFIIGVRMLIGGLGIFGYIYYTKLIDCRPQIKDWMHYTKIGIFGIFVPYCLRSWGLQYMPSTKAAFIFTLMPFSTALLSYFFHKEKLSTKKILGLTVGLAGMIPTLLTGSPVEGIYGTIGFISLPELAIIAAVISFSYNLIALQVLIKHRGCPPLLATGTSTLIGGFLAFNTSVLFESPLDVIQPHVFWPLLAVQIVVSNLICSNLQANLLKHYSPTFLAFAGFLTPICAAFFGWLFLGEQAHLSYILSFVLVLIGLLIFYYDEISKHKNIPETMVLDPKEF
ncbi:DMT family transporter [Candidatus Dependentiae bacterium]|nr:DMT family transporter [Candidatus Dependentiae bacterium]